MTIDTGIDKRQPGWHWANNEILDIYGPRLGAYGIAVYHVLARHANQDRVAWPSIGRIAEMIGVSKPTARAALDKLVEVGLIAVHQRTQNGAHLSNHYELLEVGGGKGDLPGVVKDVYQGGKPRLPEQDSENKNESTRTTEEGAGGAPAPIQVGSAARAKKERTPVPDEIRWFHEIVGCYPPKTIYAEVVATITARQDADLLRRCHAAWVAKGYNPKNLAGWFFEWYAKGEIPAHQNGNGRSRAQRRPARDATFEELKARYVPAGYEDIINY